MKKQRKINGINGKETTKKQRKINDINGKKLNYGKNTESIKKLRNKEIMRIRK